MNNKVFQNDSVVLYQGNALEVLKNIESESADSIITDPPYFLSNGGITCQNGKMVSVDKGDWDKLDDVMSMEDFYQVVLSEAKRILKKDGTIWVFGTMHNIFTLGYLLQKNDFKVLNNVTWQKSNPAPNLSCRMFTHSTETIIWARRDHSSKHYFNYDLMKEQNNGKQMKDVWTTSTTKQSEKNHGKHPTQKPLEIMDRIILASTKEDDVILDCFSGSGTTIVSAYSLGRKSIGIELNEDFIEITKARIEEVTNKKQQLSLFN
ncbi:DNA-methyltransferase [Fundicoccus culcitae]|uniref:Methyltransferase n=1 Tax=Fundicoccus culcitae TaxID=2969821 RepID=A0ABY5P478_9LACT|nr:site-specific DNA-methyltransferase [Fundicoccus culcitae]UUX33551.1 site-specific DNA-methyltransferase [Fundicoccus culcitae]